MNANQWQNAEMRAAAVDYARYAMAERGAGLEAIAGELQVGVAALSGWLEGKESPVEQYLPEVEGVAGSDPLLDMLQEEAGVLEREERELLAEALESGKALDRAQRVALAVALRGSDLAGRVELVRAVLDFVVPAERQIETIWERAETEVTVPRGTVVEVESLARPLPRGGRLGGQRLIAKTEAGKVLWVRLFADVRRTRWRYGSGGASLAVVYLRPVERFARDHVLHQFALLASMVREDGRTGKQWGELFQQKSGKAITSYHRKKLAEKLKGVDGHAGVRGVRSKPDPRKGKKREI